MTMTDSVADMITRIRNGQHARLYTVELPNSKERQGVLAVLKNEGYIRNYEVVNIRENITGLKVELKYDVNGKPVITEIKRVSKPGRRVYSKIADLKKHYNGLGLVIVSTPSGIMSDHDARVANVGGEVLCVVF